MSRSDKDKPGGHIRRSKGRLACDCCITITRTLYSEQRATRDRAAMELEALAESDEQMLDRDQHGHQFFAGRCLRCDLRWLDMGLPGVDPCPVSAEDDPVFYTTTTEGIEMLSHPIV